MTKVKSRGAQGGGSIRKRPDGRWEARYTTGFDPKTGRQIQRSIYGKTQADSGFHQNLQRGRISQAL